jgi:hypothetical protein
MPGHLGRGITTTMLVGGRQHDNRTGLGSVRRESAGIGHGSKCRSRAPDNVPRDRAVSTVTSTRLRLHLPNRDAALSRMRHHVGSVRRDR